MASTLWTDTLFDSFIDFSCCRLYVLNMLSVAYALSYIVFIEYRKYGLNIIICQVCCFISTYHLQEFVFVNDMMVTLDVIQHDLASKHDTRNYFSMWISG